MPTIRVALAQVNTTIGDIDGNVRLIVEYVARSRTAGADIVSFPELTTTGYPPEDLLLRADFVEENIEALGAVVAGCARTGESRMPRMTTPRPEWNILRLNRIKRTLTDLLLGQITVEVNSTELDCVLF